MRIKLASSILFLVFAAFSSDALSQQIAEPELHFRGQAAAFRVPGRASAADPIQLSNLVLGKLDRVGNEPRLIVLVEQFRIEKKQREVFAMRVENRVRTIKVTDPESGVEKEVEQAYTVNVPFSTKKDVPIRKAAGKKPVVIPLSKVRLYRLDASPVSEEEAAELLENMQPIFLATGFDREIKPASEIIRRALNPNCLIAVTDELQRRQPEAVAPPVPVLR